MLKIIRITAATVMLALITFYFLDFAKVLPNTYHALASVQFVPALISLHVGVLIALIVLTLLLGRIYCSVLCPLGIFQDVVARISRLTAKKKKYTFSKAKTVLRYSVLGAAVVAFLCGFTVLVGILDPYSAFGRIATNLFRPVYLAGNNLLAGIFMKFENYTLYTMEVSILSMPSFIIALLTLLCVVLLAWKHGRTWCNTVCPVGTILGLLSKYSLGKIRIDASKCNHCKACATKCKASCIDSENQKIDYSRCVDCFNCLGSCKKGALSYSFASKCDPAPKAVKTPLKVSPVKEEGDVSRRDFLALTTTVATVSMAPKLLAKENIDQVIAASQGVKAYTRANPITPPGSVSLEHFQKRCTSCHLCVSKCPSHVLKPAVMEYGLSGVMQPTVNFEKGFCNFNCTVCSQICPNHALEPLTMEEKHLNQMGYVVLIKENCIVYREGTSCGACSEHCPTQALSMVPYKDGLTVPHVNTEICVGCGGCEYVCPAKPFRAVYIEGNVVHKAAKPFVEEKTEDIKVDDFGF